MLKFQITINALLSPVKVQCRSCKKHDAYLNAIVIKIGREWFKLSHLVRDKHRLSLDNPVN